MLELGGDGVAGFLALGDVDGEEGSHLSCGQWFGEEVTLGDAAADLSQTLGLFGLLDALGGDVEAERGGERHAIAAVSGDSAAGWPRPSMKDLSILMAWTGNRRRWARDE